MTRTIGELYDLTGKGAVVTGGGRGIGQAIAFRLAEAGAGVMITDVNMEIANKTVEQMKSKGGNAQAIQADAGRVADADKVVKATVKAFGQIDILVNNAGIFPISPALETTEELWDKVLGINLKGVFFYSQAAAREMIKAGHGGRIINLGSVDALHPRAGAAHYNASKGGVLMLTKALALEWGSHNILVNAVAPGGVPTPGTLEQRRIATGIDEKTLIERRMARQPLGRMGTPDEIAKIALFLASGAADYITGTMILADGGFLLS